MEKAIATSVQEKNILDLIKEFQTVDSNSLQTILDFKSDFQKTLKDEKGKLRYRLNLLDEVNSGINENAHSRILEKLLSYRSDPDQPYEVLQSFLKHLGVPFDKLKISKPNISAEKGRIDVLIRDTDYTIIIENKINYATDQPRQIERYVELEKERKPLEQIYVLYLTSISQDSVKAPM